MRIRRNGFINGLHGKGPSRRLVRFGAWDGHHTHGTSGRGAAACYCEHGWGGGLLVRTGASADPTSQDVALMSVSGCGPMLAVDMVSVECGGASARCSNEVTDLK